MGAAEFLPDLGTHFIENLVRPKHWQSIRMRCIYTWI
mgnify:FL=1|jgi:hypothetical protein